MQDPIGDEDSSAAQLRMQSSVPGGESSLPSRRCRSRGNPETQIRQTGMRDSGQPEDSSLALPRDRGFGATRRFTLRGRWKMQEPGQPRACIAGAPEGAGCGETRRSARRSRRGSEEPGQPGDLPSVQPEDEGKGQPGDSSGSVARGARNRGNPGNHRRQRG